MGEGSIRLDKWLWQARLVKTRALAQALIEAGRVRVNRMPAGAAHKPVRPGDTLTVTLPQGVRVVRIVALGERRGPAREAITLYDDLSPTLRAAATAAEARSGPDIQSDA